jgi:hypothetical protein
VLPPLDELGNWPLPSPSSSPSFFSSTLGSIVLPAFLAASSNSIYRASSSVTSITYDSSTGFLGSAFFVFS